MCLKMCLTFKSMCLNEAQSEAQNEAHIDGEQGFPRENCSKLIKIGRKKPNFLNFVEWGPIGFYLMSLGVLNPKNGKDNFAHPHKVSVCKWAKNVKKCPKK